MVFTSLVESVMAPGPYPPDLPSEKAGENRIASKRLMLSLKLHVPHNRGGNVLLCGMDPVPLNMLTTFKPMTLNLSWFQGVCRLRFSRTDSPPSAQTIFLRIDPSRKILKLSRPSGFKIFLNCLNPRSEFTNLHETPVDRALPEVPQAKMNRLGDAQTRQFQAVAVRFRIFEQRAEVLCSTPSI